MDRVQFAGESPFYSDLKSRVDGYFDETGMSRTGNYRMFLKTVLIVFGLLLSYVWLVFYAQTWYEIVLSGLGVAFTTCLVGFNVMHDGAHGAYSRRKWINWTMGFALDLMGGSNYLWRQKHNLLHHTYTNIDELDRDLQSSGLMRLSPDQPWRSLHRFQHIYALPLYSLHTFFWAFYRDYLAFWNGRAGPVRLTAPKKRDVGVFFGTKLFYYAYALVLPSLIHPFWQVFLVFTGIHLIMGVVISVVFQLAHTTHGPEFPGPDRATGAIENAWAIHQVVTTANFAPHNKLVSWCVGGLNFQIEHHLFPRVCHVHYPALSTIVQDACRDYGIAYHCHPTFGSSLLAHFKFLKDMAQPPVVTRSESVASLSV